MRKLPLIALSLTFALALCGCVPSGAVVPQCPAPPKLPPVPASLMQPPTTGQQVRRELFEPPTTPMQPSARSRPS